MPIWDAQAVLQEASQTATMPGDLLQQTSISSHKCLFFYSRYSLKASRD